MNLYDAQNSRMSKVASIYYSCCYNKDNFASSDDAKHDQGGSCISITAARINHSCIPNAIFSYLSNSKNPVQFYAIRPIPRNREITTSYSRNIFLPRLERKRRLRLDYGFECRCEACEPMSRFWEGSDDRRRNLRESIRQAKKLEREWNISRLEKNDIDVEDDAIVKTPEDEEKRQRICKEATQNILQLETLLRKEGLVGVVLDRTHASLARWKVRAAGLNVETGESEIASEGVEKEESWGREGKGQRVRKDGERRGNKERSWWSEVSSIAERGTRAGEGGSRRR